MLGNYKWQQDILSVYQPDMGTELSEGHFDLLTFDLDIMTLTLQILSDQLVSLETIHGNCFIFSGHIMGPLHSRLILTI